MARLTTIRLYGALGSRFGRVHKLAVKTTAEAVKALCINLDGLESYLMNAKKNGMTFAVFRGKRNIGLDDYKGLAGDSDIRIAPVMEGAKKSGVFQTILGVAMVAAAIWMPGIGILASNLLFSAGVSAALGGVYQMISPQTHGLQTRQDADNKPSYAFGGAVNTIAMGNPVAVLYGEREIGGSVISAGIVAEDI